MIMFSALSRAPLARLLPDLSEPKALKASLRGLTEKVDCSVGFARRPKVI